MNISHYVDFSKDQKTISEQLLQFSKIKEAKEKEFKMMEDWYDSLPKEYQEYLIEEYLPSKIITNPLYLHLGKHFKINDSNKRRFYRKHILQSKHSFEECNTLPLRCIAISDNCLYNMSKHDNSITYYSYNICNIKNFSLYILEDHKVIINKNNIELYHKYNLKIIKINSEFFLGYNYYDEENVSLYFKDYPFYLDNKENLDFNFDYLYDEEFEKVVLFYKNTPLKELSLLINKTVIQGLNNYYKNRI